MSGYNYVALATTALISLVIARLIGPAGKGIVAGTTSWTALLVSLGTLGLPQSITYEVARGSSRSAVRKVADRLALRQVVTLVAAGSILFALLMPGDLRRHSIPYLATIPFAFVLGYRLAELQGVRDYRRWNQLRTVGSIAPIAFALVVTLIFRSPAAVLTGYAIGLLLACAITTRAARFRAGVTPSTALLSSRMLKYGVKVGITGVLFGANQQLDQALLALLIAPAGLGIYAAAVSLSGILMPISSAYAAYALADLASLPDRVRQRALAKRLAWQSTVLFAIASVAGALFGPRMLSLAFGSAFAEGATAARILFIAGGFLAEDYFLVHTLLGMGLTSPPLLAEAVGLMANVVLLVVLVPPLGYIGAAWASLAAYALTWVLLMGALLRDRRTARAGSSR